MASFLSLPRELRDMVYEHCGFHMKGREIVVWRGVLILQWPHTEQGKWTLMEYTRSMHEVTNDITLGLLECDKQIAS